MKLHIFHLHHTFISKYWKGNLTKIDVKGMAYLLSRVPIRFSYPCFIPVLADSMSSAKKRTVEMFTSMMFICYAATSEITDRAKTSSEVSHDTCTAASGASVIVALWCCCLPWQLDYCTFCTAPASGSRQQKSLFSLGILCLQVEQWSFLWGVKLNVMLPVLAWVYTWAFLLICWND